MNQERIGFWEKVGRKLFPDIYQKVDAVDGMLTQYYALVEQQTLAGKTLNLDEAAILGNLHNCHITIKPQLHTKVVLSEAKFGAALGLHGEQALVSNNYFQAFDTMANTEEGEIK